QFCRQQTLSLALAPPSFRSQLPLPHWLSAVQLLPSGSAQPLTPKHTPVPSPQVSRPFNSVHVPVLHSWQPLTQATSQHTPPRRTRVRQVAFAQDCAGCAICAPLPVIFNVTA